MASTQFRRFLSHRPLGKWKVFWEAKTNVCSIFVLFPQHLLGLIQSRMLGQVYFGDWPFSDIPLSFISHQAMHLTKRNGWNAAWGIWCSCLSLFLHQAQFAPLKSSSNTQAGASFFPFVPKEVFTSMDKASQLEAKMFWNAPGNQGMQPCSPCRPLTCISLCLAWVTLGLLFQGTTERECLGVINKRWRGKKCSSGSNGQSKPEWFAKFSSSKLKTNTWTLHWQCKWPFWLKSQCLNERHLCSCALFQGALKAMPWQFTSWWTQTSKLTLHLLRS